jgi:hypothetical protein
MPLAEDLDIVTNKISDLKNELDILNNKINLTKDYIQTQLNQEQKSMLDLISVENGNPILKYNTGVCFQTNVRSDDDNRMNIEYDPSQSAVYIHTASTHIRIPNDFRVF